MRAWYKYLLNEKDDGKLSPKDSSFEDHKRSMGGYDPGKGYGSKEDFFETYIYKSCPRHRFYHDYLKQNLKKREGILSIGSGRCANELLLAEEGFDITCSDLEQPCGEETRKIFANLKFIKFDIAKSPLQEKFDCIISLSVFYLFNEEELLDVFTNAANSLKPEGTFIFDPGGAEDNFSTRLIDDFMCRLEAHLRTVFRRITGRGRLFVTKKHQGYRTTDDEIVSIAARAGFRLRDRKTYDHVTELHRIRLFELLPDKIVGLFGKQVPYVRIFNFEKNG